MITLDQIKQLDVKVRKAIDKIYSLTDENKMLQNKLDDYQLRIEELEILIDTFKEDQSEIENGIIETLIQLEKIDADTNSSGSETQLKDQVDLNVLSEDKPESSPEENNDISETNTDTITEIDQDNSDVQGENKDNSDIELDIF